MKRRSEIADSLPCLARNRPRERVPQCVDVDAYGLTATTASSSVDGRCRDVTVSHSLGFIVLIVANERSGTLMRISPRQLRETIPNCQRQPSVSVRTGIDECGDACRAAADDG